MGGGRLWKPYVPLRHKRIKSVSQVIIIIIINGVENIEKKEVSMNIYRW